MNTPGGQFSIVRKAADGAQRSPPPRRPALPEPSSLLGAHVAMWVFSTFVSVGIRAQGVCRSYSTVAISVSFTVLWGIF